jgi:hypothetical protein
MCIRKPDHLSHIECAGTYFHSLHLIQASELTPRVAIRFIGIPENFLTAFQALFMVGNMKEGDSGQLASCSFPSSFAL